MAERTQLSKKDRFEVFKRDYFTCQYCGAKPPSVVLEIDHIDPVKNGGTNTIHNLITACFDCNRGKSSRLLSSLPETVTERMDAIAEKTEQLKAFNKLLKATKRKEEIAIDGVQELFRAKHSGLIFAPSFRDSVRKFLTELPSVVVEDAMERALDRTETPDDCIRYFCGICWKRIKGGW